MSEAEQPHRKVYSKGFFDGLRAAGIPDASSFLTSRQAMNQGRYNSIYNGQTSVAQKVFCAIPLGESVTATQIHNELVRTLGARDIKVTAGCIHNLVKIGLVIESARGTFSRVVVHQKDPDDQPPKAEIKEAVVTTSKAAEEKITPKALTPIDRLTALSARAIGMIGMLKDLATDIDSAAIEIAGEIEGINADTKKLRQLQSLLKSLN